MNATQGDRQRMESPLSSSPRVGHEATSRKPTGSGDAFVEPAVPRGHFSDWAPWLSCMAKHWSLEAPPSAPYLQPFAMAERVRGRCKLVEIGDIRQLVRAVPGLQVPRLDTCVAFDLDETLIRKVTPKSHLRCVAQGADTLDMLARLQQGHRCFGLTARPYDHAYDTFFMLDRLGIHFAGAPGKEGLSDSLPNSGNLGGVYYAGHRTPKGRLLSTLRRDFPDLRHLVFVDDQPHNFIGMVDAVARDPEELKLTCVRYSRFRDDVQEPETAAKEWAALKQVVEAHDMRKLVEIMAADAEWHRGLKNKSDPQRQRVSSRLAYALKETQPAWPKRLERLLEGVREDKLLKGRALAELAELVDNVADAQAAAATSSV